MATNTTIPVITPEGDAGSIPASNLDAALQRGFKQAVQVTSPEGDAGWVPVDKASAALARGFRIGQPAVQNIKEPSKAASVAREAALGVASGIGLPESTDWKDFTTIPGLKQIITHPINSAKLLGGAILDAGQAQQDALNRAKEAGQTYPALVHAVAAGVPMVGPAAENIGEEIGRGIAEHNPEEIAHGAGQAGGFLSLLGLGTKSGQGAIANAESAAVETPKAVVRAAGDKLVNSLGGGPTAMAKRPLPQSLAEGNATNAEVNQFAQQRGIQLTPAQATGSAPLRSIQAVAERGLFGKSAAALRSQLEENKANFANAVQDFQDRLSPNTDDTEAIGQHIKDQASARLQQLKQSAQADYDAFRNANPNLRVDLSKAKDAFPTRLQKYGLEIDEVPSVIRAAVADEPVVINGQKVMASQLPPQVRAVLGVDTPDIARAQTLRSNLLDLSRNSPDLRIRSLARDTAGDLDKAMETAANQAGVIQHFRRANATYRNIAQNFYDEGSPIGRVLAEQDATKIPQKVLAAGKEGGSPQAVRTLQQQGIDVSPLKRQVVQNVLERNFALTNGGTRLAGYSDSFLRQLFNPDELGELYNLGRVGRTIKFELNPSGTSNVMTAEHQLGKIINRSIGAVTEPAAAKLTLSPAFGRAMTRTARPRVVRTPTVTPAASSALSHLPWMRNPQQR